VPICFLGDRCNDDDAMAVKRLWKSVANFHRDEQGGAYTLSYVMVIPILMLLVAMTVETALMMTAKLGTVHAAYVAGRVASVQSSASDWTLARQRIERAARQAMVPFASGSDDSNRELSDAQDQYRDAYAAWADEPADENYVRSKERDVGHALTITIDGKPPTWDSDIGVEVTYDYPFRVPGIGRLIGDKANGGGYVFPLTTQVTMQNDAPQNRRQSMGIGYGKTP